ncbi:MAG: type II toxin-antitoxin system RelE/ParE family toxin [Pseudidiomarina maritima]|nr:type II toxin-antitoxin system RelE/ParE family toxin [Pseudidiomarina maritima]
MWTIRTTDRFDAWFDALDDTDKENVIASLLLLQSEGPFLSRPYADTLYGSVHSNLKELRIQSKGKPIRVCFAFDLSRTAIILCAAHKNRNTRLFYQTMIAIADQEFTRHLIAMGQKDNG